ncbi:MAG: helix-turn-helix domain-containing protein [Terriglobia bacterium]
MTTENTREQIAARLRTAREAAGLSQGQVARLLKWHRPTVSEIEAGRRRVAGEELAQFASLYGVSVEWLATPSAESDPAEERILLAARELSKMKGQDLDRLMSLLRMLRRSKEHK